MTSMTNAMGAVSSAALWHMSSVWDRAVDCNRQTRSAQHRLAWIVSPGVHRLVSYALQSLSMEVRAEHHWHR